MGRDAGRTLSPARHPRVARVIDKQRRDALETHVLDLVEARIIEVVPRETYALLRETALRRVPRDERDWPTVALASDRA
jgi:PIN domain